jgi:hypothetical protein
MTILRQLVSTSRRSATLATLVSTIFTFSLEQQAIERKSVEFAVRLALETFPNLGRARGLRRRAA